LDILQHAIISVATGEFSMTRFRDGGPTPGPDKPTVEAQTSVKGRLPDGIDSEDYFFTRNEGAEAPPHFDGGPDDDLPTIPHA